MTELQLKLGMMMTDRIFLIINEMKKIATMTAEETQRGIERERLIMDTLVDDVIL